MVVGHEAARTAAEKGIEIGLFNSPGWSCLGAPGSNLLKACVT